MNHFEIDDCLRSMEIIVDTREQPSKRAQKRYESFCAPYTRQTMNYGDYTYNFNFPNGEKLFKNDEVIKGHAIIERKQDLIELSQCFCQSRERFEREFQRAKENNASIYLVVEDASWENLINGKYATKFNSKAFLASITAWMVRYDIKIVFCKSETSGKLIREILYRELKERLENGFYG